MICTLRVLEGPAAGETRQLHANQTLSIGRGDSDLCVPDDPHLSRHHLLIEGKESSFQIRDVGSSNGTFLNNCRIAIAQLCEGDQIKAGTSVFEIRFEEQADQPERDQSHFNEPKVKLEHAPTRTLSGFGPKLTLDETARLQEIDGRLVRVGYEASSSEIPGEIQNEFEEIQDGIWKQRFTNDKTGFKRFCSVLRNTSWEVRFQLVVNMEQLSTADQLETESQFTTPTSYENLTETLRLFSNINQGLNLELYERCMNQDAAICLATRDTVSEEWLKEHIGGLSYPSLFANYITAAKHIDLGDSIVAIFYEPNRRYEINMFVGS